MAYVYILASEKTNKYYIGSSDNVIVRVIAHNSGKVISTKTERPWKLVYSEIYSNMKMARKRERQIKNWKNRVAIERLFKNKI